jgi:peptidoglycan/LPS O-acetylase OafA/YrhL
MSPKPLGHRPALDGLRGVAILAVVGINAEWPFFKGGFLGVDLFFVLSGFLITTLLLEEGERRGTISLKRFFARRALRLMPALVVLLLTAGAYSILWRPEAQRADALKLVVASLCYASNWLIAIAGVHGTLEHTWSLAVEGQFYVAWGVALWLLHRSGAGFRRIAVCVVACLLASTLWRVWLWIATHDVYRVYMGLDTRADTLLAGCLTALAIRSPGLMESAGGRAKWTGWMAGACWATFAVCVANAGYRDATTYLFVLPLAAAASSLLVFLSMAGQPRWMMFALEWPGLVWLGRISYSVYLWHVPLKNILSLSRLEALGMNALAAQGIRFAAFIIAGCASYYLVERPFLRLKARYGSQGSGLRHSRVPPARTA